MWASPSAALPASSSPGSTPSGVASLSLVNTFCRMEDPWRGYVAAGFKDFAEAMDALGWRSGAAGPSASGLDTDKATPELSEWLCKEIGKVDLTWAKKWMTYRPDFVSRLPELPSSGVAPGSGRAASATQDQQRDDGRENPERRTENHRERRA